jgi:MFS family permease
VRSFREIARVLRHRDYRYLWLSQTTSAIGDAIVFVALALFVIDRTGSPTDLGLVLAAGTVPLLVFLLVGGVWADRLPRHAVVIVTDLTRFALHGLLAVLIFTGEVAIWQLVVIEALFGAAEAFFRPAISGLVPQTVPEADIQQANALMGMSRNAATLAGPALATVLVLTAGAGWAFALDAATFLVSAACLTRVRPRRRELAPAAAERPVTDAAPSVWAEMREGYREVRSRAWIWATLVAFSVINLTGLAPLFVLGPIVARERYGHTAIYGVVIAVLGIGTIAGSLAGINWRPRHPMRMATLAIMLWPPSIVLFGAGVTLWLVLPAAALAGFGLALFDVWWLTALAERVPPDKLSRVTSYDWVVSNGLLPLGLIIAGPLASALGAVAVLIAGTTLAGLAIGAALLSRDTWRLERLPQASGQTGLP